MLRITSLPASTQPAQPPDVLSRWFPQAALDALFADTIHQGRRRVLHAEVQHHIDRISDLSQRLGLSRVHPDWNDGAFSGRLTTLTNGIAIDNVCSLGRLSFNKVQPVDMLVETDQATAAGFAEDPDQYKGPLANVEEDPAHGYSVVTYFKILSNGVTGRMVVQALYEVDPEDPAKLIVTFAGFRLEPAHGDEKSLALWREALAEHNPGMDDRGGIDFKFEKRAKGTLMYILMDPEWHLALGGSGALTAMQRTTVRPH
ncbi:hypothetical protein GPECTOR_41g707 [Gonium pectorale]|uniref:Uncharacterized protein n=1 Tax=Gonium pectorale TaxID=33097 RepID=A0A150GA78_GONPE|nr:hypothetical protein GPECTOR_41g707 [Gonium pectorale]|eukprot:KXZ46742.1 hypothetical protein GPECTOR_41g707 [Gonium pectorale]